MTTPRLGYFTRLLDDAPPVERYRNALAQIVRAEELGFDTAWVAQHHFHRDEGGLPSPFVFLAQAALATSRIVLATGIVTLPLEAPLRVAEDAAVLWLLSDGRFELGIGSGGTPTSFPPFGHRVEDRPTIYAEYKATLLNALRGAELTTDGGALHPPAPQLVDTVWEATFSAGGAERIGAEGHGLMLSRTQPRREYTGRGSAEDQVVIVDSYRAALPSDIQPRVMASRSVLVVDTDAEAREWRAQGIERSRRILASSGVEVPPGRPTPNSPDTSTFTSARLRRFSPVSATIRSCPSRATSCSSHIRWIRLTRSFCDRSNSSQRRSPPRSAGCRTSLAQRNDFKQHNERNHRDHRCH